MADLQDRFGRELAWVWAVDGARWTFCEASLVERGLAELYLKFPVSLYFGGFDAK